jgi:tellurite resistance protein
MNDQEKLELLKAALAVAAADGELRRSEMGVVEGLAARVGVGKVSLDAMTAAAGQAGAPCDIVMRSPHNARTALELLVAEARIDGEITDAERSVIATIANRLGITGDEFARVYQAGVVRADRIRKRP